MQSLRAVLLASVSAGILFGASASHADTPSNEDLYKMLREQQKIIRELRDELKRTQQELRQTRGLVQRDVTAAKKEAAAARKEVEATRQAVREREMDLATKADLERARAELGTQPSQSLFRLATGMSQWKLYGDFLFLRASSNQTAFTDFEVPGDGRVIPFKSSYDPGFRLGGSFAFGNGMDAHAAYTYFRTSGTTNATGLTLGENWLSLIPSYYAYGNRGTAKLSIDYDTVDFDVGVNFLVGSDVQMRGFGGLRYVRIDQRSQGSITFVNGTLHRADARSDYWGIGPRMGLQGQWNMGWGFNVFGHFAGTLAVGTSKRLTKTWHGMTDCQPCYVDGGSTTIINPGIDASLGLGYSFAVNGMTAHLKVGYEVHHWFNTRPFKGGSAHPDSMGQSSSQGFGLDGFFVRGVLTW